MAFQLTFEEKEGYLHFHVHGDNSVETVEGYLQQMRGIIEDRKLNSVLVEENLKGPSLGMANIFEIITGRIKSAWKLKRIAFVDQNPEHDKSRMSFAQTVGTNRGMRIRVFENVKDAEQWLQSA